MHRVPVAAGDAPSPTISGSPYCDPRFREPRYFISLVKFSKKPTKAGQAVNRKAFAEQETMAVKNIGLYWTIGRYDAVRIFEAPDEKAAMKVLTLAPEHVHTETLLALPRDEVDKLLA